MLILNLDPTFAPFGAGVVFDQFVFPSGSEVHVKLPPLLATLPGFDGNVLIVARLASSDDIMKLLLLVDALRRFDGVANIDLYLPFLPYARQDRVMVAGEPLSIAVFARLLNLCAFRRVYILDAHSEVSLALINGARAIDNSAFVGSVLAGKNEYRIVCPDAGAHKKIDCLAETLDYDTGDIVMCNKVRDVSTGWIKRITVSESDLDGRDAYIIDDICDGGATFIALADALRARNAGRVFLIVTHGIFSKGEDVLRAHLDGIFTTNSIKDIVSTFITQEKLCMTNQPAIRV